MIRLSKISSRRCEEDIREMEYGGSSQNILTFFRGRGTVPGMSFLETHRGELEGRIVISGRGPLSEVSLEVVPSTLEIDQDKLSHLPEILEELGEAGITVTDGPTYRLEAWSVGERLRLFVSRRSYFDSVLLKRFPQWGVRSQVLALVAVTLSPDGYLVEERSAKVAALPGRLHPLPSGSVEPPSHPLDTLYNEAFEEIGLASHELEEIECLGLVYGEESGVYQLVCRATVEVRRTELEARSCSGAWEKDSLMFAPSEAAELGDWLSRHRERLTVGGRTALLMEGARRFGDDWLAANLP